MSRCLGVCVCVCDFKQSVVGKTFATTTSFILENDDDVGHANDSSQSVVGRATVLRLTLCFIVRRRIFPRITCLSFSPPSGAAASPSEHFFFSLSLSPAVPCSVARRNSVALPLLRGETTNHRVSTGRRSHVSLNHT